jgi:hypothetical protein
MLTFFLYMLARRIPMMLVTIVCGGFAIARWKRHPRPSLMALLALVFYWVEAFLLIIVRYLIPNVIQTMHLSSNAISALFAVVSVLDDFAFAVIIILLVAAAFIGRGAGDNYKLEGQLQ